ncbi:2-phosphosulfolactate phosphatase [Halalkalibacter urbisdiaboli]|uniref:2-phosphosulfolactate phosphatase n=1 Tax=Halalkalibacter urbisdiaboli TaxID=1960589 RepID=UPI000B433DF0|nr:2-phosphosulfolactate phosphatase [Halalkalibacter urbisdiaboli]
MSITIYQGNEHSLPPSDINIVIDVIRAFTVAHHAFLKGASNILLVESVEDALLLKNKHPHYLLAGEVNGLAIKGFDLDNSPERFANTNLSEKTLVQKTTNGVKATLNSLNTKQLFVTGFSNARMTANYIRKLYKDIENLTIHIIASHPTGDDDLACAEFIRNILTGERDVASETKRRIMNSTAAKKFFDPQNLDFNREDIRLCTKELNHPFIMKVNKECKIPMIERIDI